MNRAAAGADLAALVDRVPEGWTLAEFDRRRYGLIKTTHGDGRSASIFAEQLGGTDVVSANVYRTSAGEVLKPCEMPAATVLDFLRGWQPADQASPVFALGERREEFGADLP